MTFPGTPILPAPWVVTSLAPLLLPLPRAPALARGPALTNLSIHLSTEDFEGDNPQVPKLEKSISGTSPKREHLPLAVGIAFFLMTLLAS
jgi:Eph receptor A10